MISLFDDLKLLESDCEGVGRGTLIDGLSWLLHKVVPYSIDTLQAEIIPFYHLNNVCIPLIVANFFLIQIFPQQSTDLFDIYAGMGFGYEFVEIDELLEAEWLINEDE